MFVLYLFVHVYPTVTKSHVESANLLITRLRTEASAFDQALTDLNIVGQIKFMNFIHDLQMKVYKDFHKPISKTMVRKQLCLESSKNPSKFIYNVSKMKLSNIETEALLLGLKFRIPKTSTEKIYTEAQFGNLFEICTQ